MSCEIQTTGNILWCVLGFFFSPFGGYDRESKLRSRSLSGVNTVNALTRCYCLRRVSDVQV